MFKKNEPVLVPVYINLEAEVVIYKDILNNGFVYDRINKKTSCISGAVELNKKENVKC